MVKRVWQLPDTCFKYFSSDQQKFLNSYSPKFTVRSDMSCSFKKVWSKLFVGVGPKDDAHENSSLQISEEPGEFSEQLSSIKWKHVLFEQYLASRDSAQALRVFCQIQEEYEMIKKILTKLDDNTEITVHLTPIPTPNGGKNSGKHVESDIGSEKSPIKSIAVNPSDTNRCPRNKNPDQEYCNKISGNFNKTSNLKMQDNLAQQRVLLQKMEQEYQEKQQNKMQKQIESHEHRERARKLRKIQTEGKYKEAVEVIRVAVDRHVQKTKDFELWVETVD